MNDELARFKSDKTRPHLVRSEQAHKMETRKQMSSHHPA
ncbi:hypothetical protein MY9_4037 [Bacillus sp. JS]|nr:hypothetical protein MY9_4037 [Bacillus sp. JS]